MGGDVSLLIGLLTTLVWMEIAQHFSKIAQMSLVPSVKIKKLTSKKNTFYCLPSRTPGVDSPIHWDLWA